MGDLLGVLHFLILLIGIFFLVMSWKNHSRNYLLIAFWLGIGALIFHYQISGGEILGSYFNYRNALVYSFNIFLLLFCIIAVFNQTQKTKPVLLRFVAAILLIGCLISALCLLINLWINAYFIENKLPGTPILQVANFNKTDFCNYPYVFYKINKEGQISAMCPNYYGVFPSIHKIDLMPEFLKQQFSPFLQKLSD